MLWGHFLQSFFTVPFEVFYCRNAYVWIDLLMSPSLVFMDLLRTDTRCGLQRLTSAISLAVDHPYTCVTWYPWLQHHVEVKFARLLLQSLILTFRENIFTVLVKWNICIPSGPMTIHVVSAAELGGNSAALLWLLSCGTPFAVQP